jgi:phage terminase large subunit-like protein
MSWLSRRAPSLEQLAKERLSELRRDQSGEHAEELSGSLRQFIRPAWSQLEPMNPLIWGWHIDAIAEHLEAAAAGHIRTLLINIPPRHLKPLDEEILVLRGDGLRVPLREIVVGDLVITHCGRPRRVKAVSIQGELDCIEIETHHGRIVRAAPDHPFLTPEGWIEAGKLEPGHHLAVPSWQVATPIERRDEEFRLAGYFIGDGNVTQAASETTINANIHCHDAVQMVDIKACADALGFGWSLLGGSGPYAGKRILFRQGIRDWLRANGMARCTSWTKRVPEFVYRGSDQQVAQFVGAYFACDGTLNTKGTKREDLCLSFTSVNRGLLEDVQHLLARFGVPGRIRRRDIAFGKKHGFIVGPYTYFQLEITGTDGVARFAASIPVPGVKMTRIMAWGPKRTSFAEGLMADRVIAVREAGKLRCRCLEIEEDGSFTANDLAVHNSSLVGVIFPAWLWTRNRALKLLTGSYAMPLATRDATRTRRLILSSWYRRQWPQVELEADQFAKMRYDLVGGGARYCFSTAGIVTGEGGDVIIYDDPHKPADMYSDAKIEAAVQFWTEVLPTRVNNPLTATKIIIMQRLGERDLSGYILSKAADRADSNLVHLMLPAHFDPLRPCQTRWFRDPRKEQGELLWPELMSSRALYELTEVMSPPAIAAQLEQQPTEPGGAIINRKWWRVWSEWKRPKCHLIVLSIDTSMKEKEMNDPWACTVWGVWPNQELPQGQEIEGRENWSVILIDAWEAWITYPQAKIRILQTIEDHTVEDVPPDYVIVEDKAAGPALLSEFEHAGVDGLVSWPPAGLAMPDKVARAKMVSDIPFHGRVWVLGRKLADRTRSSLILPKELEKVVAQCAKFPNDEHDDLVDTATQLWWWLRAEGYLALDTDSDDRQVTIPERAPEPREAPY